MNKEIPSFVQSLIVVFLCISYWGGGEQYSLAFLQLEHLFKCTEKKQTINRQIDKNVQIIFRVHDEIRTKLQDKCSESFLCFPDKYLSVRRSTETVLSKFTPHFPSLYLH